MRDLGQAQVDRAVDARAVDREVRGQPHAPVVPGRLRVPLVGEHQPGGEGEVGRHQGEPGRALHLLGERPGDRVGHVHLAALQGGQPGRLVRDVPEHERLHHRGLPPVLLVGLQGQLDPRLERDELVRPRAHRGLLEALVAHLLDVLPRHDPGGAGRRGRVEGQEVGPRLLQGEADAVGVERLDLGDLALEEGRARPAVALEGELHVLGRHHVAVVETDVLAQHELVDEAVLRLGPRLGERRRHRLAGHRLHEGVVQGVQHHEGRDDAGGLGRIEPGRGQGDVNGPRDLALGPGGHGGSSGNRARPRREAGPGAAPRSGRRSSGGASSIGTSWSEKGKGRERAAGEAAGKTIEHLRRSRITAVSSMRRKVGALAKSD